jgi:signal transduction histidine kinase/ActR/RegA family two-component response regulator
MYILYTLHIPLAILIIGVLVVGILFYLMSQRYKAKIEELHKTIRENKEDIQEQIDRAEKSESYKEFFLANMSHEIRTPMHAISGMTNILRRNDHPKEQDKYLGAIHQSAENLLVILNDILDSSKIEAGKLKIDSIPMNPVRVIEDVVEILRLRAEDKGLQLKHQIEGNIPEQVLGDPIRLNQILTNLASNAIKFTESGSVQISLKVKQEDGEELMAFAVQDTGIGIPDDKLKTIFEVFEQVDGTLSKKFGGTGLGLSISKQLVEMQGGMIDATSILNQGSTFTFRLPLKPITQTTSQEVTITEEELVKMGTAMGPLKVLLAEDNDFNVMLAKDDLSYYVPGIQIETAANGKIAFEMFKAQQYDLVLMDIQMPEMNGYEAARNIREWEASQPKSGQIPIIAMTASLLKAEIVKCYEVGMDNFIPKPYKIEELIGTIYEEAMKKKKN